MLAIGINHENAFTFSRTFSDELTHEQVVELMDEEMGEPCDEVIIVKNDVVVHCGAG